jgi:hypothetical protein
MSMDQDVNPNKNCCTTCSGDKSNNIWFVNGKCELDSLTYEQVWTVLMRNPDAKRDLQRITSDPVLLTLAANTRLIEPEQDDDQRFAKRVNGGASPFYTLFRGNMGGGF